MCDVPISTKVFYTEQQWDLGLLDFFFYSNYIEQKKTVLSLEMSLQAKSFEQLTNMNSSFLPPCQICEHQHVETIKD